MNAPLAEPPREMRALSTEVWDPRDPALGGYALDDLMSRMRDALSLMDKQLELFAASGSDSLGLAGPDVSVPDGWAETQGSPLYWARRAAGALYILANGAPCRKAAPAGKYTDFPPPDGRLRCDHKPPHYEPRA